MKMSKKKRAVADRINEATKYCREFAPGLVMARATLLPFEDVIYGESAGPQPAAQDYDPDEEPYFTVDIDDPGNAGGETWAKVTAHGVVISYTVKTPDGETFLGDEIKTTLDGLWDYLRQLPRSAGGYFRNR
jgi:hypothetical protein